MSLSDQGVLTRDARDEIREIAECDLSNLLEGLGREEPLVTTDQDIMEGHQAHQQVVLNDLTGVIVVEQFAFSFIDIHRHPTQPLRLQRLDDCRGIYESTT